MKPYYEDDQTTLYLGDALEVLRTLPDASVDCCVTHLDRMAAVTVAAGRDREEGLSMDTCPKCGTSTHSAERHCKSPTCTWVVCGVCHEVIGGHGRHFSNPGAR